MSETKKTCGLCCYFDGDDYCEERYEAVDPDENGCSWFRVSKIRAAFEASRIKAAAIDAAKGVGE